MSWIEKLYDTYQYCLPLVGKIETEDSPILMPIAHTTQNAHVELCIDTDGNFLPGTARVIESKTDSITIIPCTEKSQSRTGSNPENHPLFDKIQYMAGDYTAFGGEKGKGFHEKYMKDLRAWCGSPYSNSRACAILKYLEKDTLISDLFGEKIFPIDENGNIIRKWDSKKYGEKCGIFNAGSILNDALDAFIRIDVISAEKAQPQLWNDPRLWEDFIEYYSHRDSREDICYVQGVCLPCSDVSPGKIRGNGDRAKLISSNDTSGFTYRGRFTDASQVVQIGYETTQKAHNALKWLIAKQGFRNGDQVYVTWGTKNEQPVDIQSDGPSLMEASFGSEDDVPYVYTEYVRKLNKLMAGYYQKIKSKAGMVTMGLDAATSGRMSIMYYEEISGEEYLKMLGKWYLGCAWRLDYIKKNEKGKSLGVYGTPSPKDLLFAAYGQNCPDKLKKSAMRQIMACILDGQKMPRNLMESAAHRASTPTILNEMDLCEYTKTLCVACAMIRKYYIDKGVKYKMALENENMERSYLFGRVLAYYQYIEANLLEEANEERPTNAMRLKNAYSRRPAKTLKILDDKVQPYIAKCFSSKKEIIDDLVKTTNHIASADMTDEPLNPTYLLGYSAQLIELKKLKGEEK